MKKNWQKIDLEEKLKAAIARLYKKDRFLIDNDLNERSISHKLAEYLQTEFHNFDVDCEYNRMKGNKSYKN